MTKRKDWRASTERGIAKAAKIKTFGWTQDERGSFWVQSNTNTDHWYEVLVGEHDLRDQTRVSFWCECREGVGPQAPVGWLGCWHAGAVACLLLEHHPGARRDDFYGILVNDLRGGLTAVTDGATVESERQGHNARS